MFFERIYLQIYLYYSRFFWTIIRDAALSILGAATPAELATALSPSDWYNGNLARFGLLTPETDYRERPTPQNSPTPHALAERLQRLHERLPEPPAQRHWRKTVR